MTVFKPGVFTGKTTSRAVNDALLSEVWHETSKVVAPHVHELDYFSILLEGSYREWSADFRITYEPYTLVFHSAQQEHQDEITAAGTRLFFIELYPRWSELLRSMGPPRAHFFELHGGDPTWLALRLYHEFLCGDIDTESVVESLLLELCSFVPTDATPDKEPFWIATVDERLHAGFSDTLSIAAVAAGVGVHPVHLCRTFRRFRGRSVGEHIRGLRVQFVCRRLADSDEALSDIATAAGFSDQSHMARLFKRVTGSAPGAYRESVRSGRP